MLICGDFNFNEINWEINEVCNEGQVIDASNFLDSINDCFLQQHVSEPTHNTDGDNPSKLDLIFTREEQEICNIEMHAPLGKSHHAVITFDFLVESYSEELMMPLCID